MASTNNTYDQMQEDARKLAENAMRIQQQEQERRAKLRANIPEYLRPSSRNVPAPVPDFSTQLTPDTLTPEANQHQAELLEKAREPQTDPLARRAQEYQQALEQQAREYIASHSPAPNTSQNQPSLSETNAQQVLDLVNPTNTPSQKREAAADFQTEANLQDWANSQSAPSPIFNWQNVSNNQPQTNLTQAEKASAPEPEATSTADNTVNAVDPVQSNGSGSFLERFRPNTTTAGKAVPTMAGALAAVMNTGTIDPATIPEATQQQQVQEQPETALRKAQVTDIDAPYQWSRDNPPQRHEVTQEMWERNPAQAALLAQENARFNDQLEDLNDIASKYKLGDDGIVYKYLRNHEGDPNYLMRVTRQEAAKVAPTLIAQRSNSNEDIVSNPSLLESAAKRAEAAVTYNNGQASYANVVYPGTPQPVDVDVQFNDPYIKTNPVLQRVAYDPNGSFNNIPLGYNLMGAGSLSDAGQTVLSQQNTPAQQSNLTNAGTAVNSSVNNPSVAAQSAMANPVFRGAQTAVTGIANFYTAVADPARAANTSIADVDMLSNNITGVLNAALDEFGKTSGLVGGTYPDVKSMMDDISADSNVAAQHLLKDLNVPINGESVASVSSLLRKAQTEAVSKGYSKIPYSVIAAALKRNIVTNKTAEWFTREPDLTDNSGLRYRESDFLDSVNKLADQKDPLYWGNIKEQYDKFTPLAAVGANLERARDILVNAINERTAAFIQLRVGDPHAKGYYRQMGIDHYNEEVANAARTMSKLTNEYTLGLMNIYGNK